MDKTKDIEFEIDGIKRCFRLHAMKFKDLALIRDALNSGFLAGDGEGVTDSISKVVLNSVEQINAESGVSMGFCKVDELDALLGNPFAIMEIICESLEFQKSFCSAYPKSRNLISVVLGLISSGSME